MTTYDGAYNPEETSLFDEQMSLAPSFSADTGFLSGPANGANFEDDQPYRQSSADALYPSLHHSDQRMPSPLATYSGAVAPFSQVYQNQPLSPFGSLAYSAAAGTAAPAYASLPAGVTSSSTLAMQAEIHRQHRVQQHPGFLDPRHQVALLQSREDEGISPATITPSAMQSISVASTPSGSASPPPVASTSKSAAETSNSSRKGTSSSSTTKKLAPSTSRSKRPHSASPAPTPPPHDPEAWSHMLPTIRSHLTAKRLQASPLSTAPKLLKDLRLFSRAESSDSPWGDSSDVPPEGRAEFLHNLLKYAKEEFWRVFLEVGQDKTGANKGKGKEDGAGSEHAIESHALELLQGWLEGASRSALREKGSGGSSEKDRKRKELEQTTLMLVLQTLAKLPVTYEHLASFRKIPKRVKAIGDKAADGAVKAAAMHLVAKWGKVQERAMKTNGTAVAAAAAPKRKADPAEAGTAKKAKTDAAPASSTAKKPPAAPAPAGPKAALPSFKKTAPAQPAFLAALASVQKSSSSGAVDNASTATGVKPVSGTPSAASKPGVPRAAAPKKKKRVHWPEEDEELCKYRVIEARELAESEENGAVEEIGGETHHLMEQQEGQTLVMHLELADEEPMEPEIDYYEPPDAAMPDADQFKPLRQPKQSREVAIQTAREETAVAVDLSGALPDSPGEDLVQAEAVGADAEEPREFGFPAALADDPSVRLAIAQAQMSESQASDPASNDQIVALLSQLSSNGIAQTVEEQQGLLPAQQNPHQLPFGAGPPGPHAQAQPPPNQIDASTLEALRQFDPSQIDEIVRSTPGLHGLDLSAIGVGAPGYPPQDMGPGGMAPPHGYPGVPDYHGYVPPPAAPVGHPAWNVPPPGGFPQMMAPNAYHGYQPPPQPHAPMGMFPGPPGMPGPHRAPAGRQHPQYKTQQCKFFRTQKGCDWGEHCRFLHG